MKERHSNKIGIITTGHLCSSPRLVKEMRAAEQCNYSGDVIFIQTLPFLAKLDRDIMEKYDNFNYTKIPWYQFNFFKKILSKIIFLTLKNTSLSFFHPFSSFLLIYGPRKVNCLIGHNLGALPIIYYLSIFFKSILIKWF